MQKNYEKKLKFAFIELLIPINALTFLSTILEHDVTFIGFDLRF